MRIGPAAKRPMIFSFRFLDWEIVDACVAKSHQAIAIKLPVLIAVGPIRPTCRSPPSVIVVVRAMLQTFRRLKSLTDDFRKLLGHRDGMHVDNDLIDLAIFVEVHLIDRLKLLALELALKAKKVAIVPCISR